MSKETFDLVVIGAGTHGTGVAADAAGRGLRVCVLDPQDIGETTASVSSRLLVGGLRYLEQWHIGLVRQSLAERQVLMNRAPCLVQVRSFIQIVHPQRMKAWKSRFLLHAYDWLGARKLGSHKAVDLNSHPLGGPIRDEFSLGLSYQDCTGNDARIAVLNARLATESNAVVSPRTQVRRIRREERQWFLDTENMETGEASTVITKALVNTAGPWVEDLLRQTDIRSRCRARQVKISHLVVPALYEGDQVYVLTSANGHRICVNPQEDGTHLIGAAENDYGGQPNPERPSASEIAWLCEVVSEYFCQTLREQDVLHAYSGLRTVYDDPGRPGTQVARHFLLDLDCPECHSPLLRVYGGRVTNYRCMSESALEVLKPWLPTHAGRWTRHTPLPGGTLRNHDPAMLEQEITAAYPTLDAATVRRLMRCYGSDTDHILAGRPAAPEPLQPVAAGLLAGELRHLYEHEWVRDGTQALRRVGLERLGTPENLAELNKVLAGFSADSPGDI